MIYKYAILFIAALLLIIFTDISLLAIIGIILVAYVGYNVITSYDDALPIGQIALLIGGIQWIVSPIIAYHSSQVTYPMAVPENEYLLYTLILYLPLFYGIFYYSSHKTYIIKKESLLTFCSTHKKGIKILVIIGFIASIIQINIPSLLFIKVLIENLLYIGAVMLCFAFPKRTNVILVFFLGYLFIRSIMGGAFHDLMVWGIFILLSIFYLKGYTLKRRICIIAVLLVAVSTIQVIKPIYRSYTWWGGYKGNQIELFANLFAKSITGELDVQEGVGLSERLNQGWIISRIYKRIPDEQPYLGGKTIIEGVEATLVPRFIAPNKKGAGESSIDDFETFTGYRLNGKTSMGISILGEAYGNFGLLFGAVFMFVWGAFIAKLVSWLHKLSVKTGYYYFFMPIICFDLIKAEINFISVFNWTVKALIFSFLVIFILTKCIEKSNDFDILQVQARSDQ